MVQRNSSEEKMVSPYGRVVKNPSNFLLQSLLMSNLQCLVIVIYLNIVHINYQLHWYEVNSPGEERCSLLASQ